MWFPSLSSTSQNIPRDAFQEPLRNLREAGLVVVADWVAGRGQGYKLTPEGQAALVREAVASNDAVAVLPDAATEAVVSKGLNRGELVREALEHPRPALISPAILFACVIWFIVGGFLTLEQGYSGSAYLKVPRETILLRLGSIHGLEILKGEWWRLLVAAFVHNGGIHLIANLFSLALIGPAAESLWGRKRFVILYLLSAVGSSCAAAALDPDQITAGASGAIWGLTSALIVWVWRYREHIDDRSAQEWTTKLCFIVGANILISFLPGISWKANFGGGLVGLATAIFLDWTRQGERRRKIAAGVVGLTAVACGLIGGLWAISYRTPDWQQLRNEAAALQNPDKSGPKAR
ncbi:MAG: rhomboid family intramembrane serine protease [Fimbriiglobus sp.]